MIAKVVIITGAGGGIGRAASLAFAKAGFRVALTDVDETALKKTGELLAADGAVSLLYPGDLASFDFLQALTDRVVEQWGRVDVLVNNAAWRTIGSLRTIRPEDWNRTLGICLTAPVFLSRAVAAVMEQLRTPGVIINVSSVMAERPAGTSPAYIAAKGALESLTKELAVTYGRSGIRVVAVAPGYIETRLSQDYVDDEGRNVSDQLIQNLVDYVPLGRGGLAGEVADAVVWLSSGGASYITGTTLVIDGGFRPNFSTYSEKRLQFPDEF